MAESLMFNGRGLSSGKFKGTVLKTSSAFSFSRDVDRGSGVVRTSGSDIFGEALYNRVLVIPEALASGLCDNVISMLNFYKGAPGAVVAGVACEELIEACAAAGVPLVDSVDCEICRTGDIVVVDGDSGTVELVDVPFSSVVTSVLFNARGELLIVKRSSRMGSHAGAWSCISGHIENDESPENAAIRELGEETGVGDVECLSGAPSLAARDVDRLWIVHPFAVSKSTGDIVLNKENTEYRWASLEDVERLEAEGSTVPRLAETVRRASAALRSCPGYRQD